jgi:hypothetical protein
MDNVTAILKNIWTHLTLGFRSSWSILRCFAKYKLTPRPAKK